MKRDTFLLSAASVFLLIPAGWGNCTEPGNMADTKAQPVIQAAPAKSLQQTDPLVAGKIMETMDSGAYTYMLLEKDGRKGWVAVPTMKVSVGQEIQLNMGYEMGQFTSKTLKRTFEQIVFTNAPVGGGKAPKAAGEAKAAAAKPAGHPPMTGTGGAASTAAPLTGKVVETMEGGGYTYVYLEKEGEKTWVAVPVMDVKVGDDMVLQPGLPMLNFTSKSLNRTFGSVIFSGGPVSR